MWAMGRPLPEGVPELQPQPTGAAFRRTLRLGLIVFWTLLLFPPIWIIYAMGLERLRAPMVALYYRGVGSIVGLRVCIEGAPERARPLLIVSNHVSYLDILALGGHMPSAFTPKSEIAHWPIIGYFCRMAGCVFIDRRPRAVTTHRTALEAALKKETPLVLFPEGTTGIGAGTLPFRGGFFSMVQWHYEETGAHLPIQLLAIDYRALDGVALTPAARPQVAWIGEAEFAPHLMALLGHRRVDVTLRFLPAFTPAPETDRKELAAQCERAIAAQLPPALPAPEIA